MPCGLNECHSPSNGKKFLRKGLSLSRSLERVNVGLLGNAPFGHLISAASGLMRRGLGEPRLRKEGLNDAGSFMKTGGP
jgi:hypothetical protein